MISRSCRKSAWDAQADALERDTRTTTSTQLPPALAAETAGQRALLWPPLQAAWLTSCGGGTCWPGAHPTTSDSAGPDRSAACSRSG
jgi:hypothetical protein